MSAPEANPHDQYDNVSWHLEDGLPNGLPDDAAGTHIGFYWHWLVSRQAENNLISTDIIKTLSPAVLDDSKAQAPGAVVALLGGQLDATMLTELGNRFTDAYYDQYLDDLADLATDAFQDDDISPYELPNDWEVFEAVKMILDARFEDWLEDPEAAFPPLELAPEEDEEANS